MKRWLIRCIQYEVRNPREKFENSQEYIPVAIKKSSVADPDQEDPYVFGPSGSGSISQRSGSFYHQSKIVRKTLIPTVLWLFMTFYLCIKKVLAKRMKDLLCLRECRPCWVWRAHHRRPTAHTSPGPRRNRPGRRPGNAATFVRVGAQ